MLVVSLRVLCALARATDTVTSEPLILEAPMPIEETSVPEALIPIEGWEQPPVIIEEPLNPPLPRYNRCKAAVLANWDRQQATAFPVTVAGKVDTHNGKLLELEDQQMFGSATVRVASLPFDSVFAKLMFAADRSVHGYLPTDSPDDLRLVAGIIQIEQLSEVTIDGFSGYLYMLDARSECKN